MEEIFSIAWGGVGGWFGDDSSMLHLVCILFLLLLHQASLVAQLVKNLPAIPETPVHFLGQEDSPEEKIGYPLQYSWVSLMAQTVKNPPANPDQTWV